MPVTRSRPVRKLVQLISATTLVWATAGYVHAQTSTENLSTKQAKQKQLELIKSRLKNSQQRQISLRKEIKLLSSDIGAINRALITTAQRTQHLESDVTKAEEKVVVSIKSQKTIQDKLASKRALLGEVLAALQRMGRKPPPAILVRPEDALISVRSAIVLGAVVPEVRQETQVLLTELQELKNVTTKVEMDKRNLTKKLNELTEDETRLSLLIEEKSKLNKRSKAELEQQQEETAKLASKATSLANLIDMLETKIASAAAAAQAAKLADAKRTAKEANRLKSAKEQLKASVGNSKDTARIEPAIAFSAAKKQLLLPVSGVKLYEYGSEPNKKNNNAFILGSKTENIAIQTRPNARVRAPADSWVVYAGPFRSYGDLLILNAGEGYHIVLSGLDQVNVETGRFVLAGEPIGRMGLTRVSSGLAANLGSNSPVLYVEFRKDGNSIDSAPWWSPLTTTHLQAGDG